jgi:hypothetical protein
MADALVTLLNRAGYQPVFLPRTGLTPPELYNYGKETGKARLIRRGPLADYLPEPVDFEVIRSSLPDISHAHTSSKDLSASVSFLSRCLACLGITAVPSLDLSFAGTNQLVFAFKGVWSLRVEPSALDHMLRSLDLGAIPEEYVERGFLHVAYDYAFTPSLVVQREDRRAFSAGVDGDIGQFIQLGADAKVAVEDRSTISFNVANAHVPAFAYKSGRLVHDTRWRFYPEETYRSGTEESSRPFVMRRGVVLDAE